MLTKNSKIFAIRGHGTKLQYREKSESSGWREACAMLGLAGGFLCNFFGLALTGLTWFMSARGIGPTMHSVGTVLLIANIPLLIAGAHCLDLAEKNKRVALPIR
ncbi:MAG TPA: hypothetical protein VF899_13215 [Pyrinomonadaceae bacterium]